MIMLSIRLCLIVFLLQGLPAPAYGSCPYYLLCLCPLMFGILLSLQRILSLFFLPIPLLDFEFWSPGNREQNALWKLNNERSIKSFFKWNWEQNALWKLDNERSLKRLSRWNWEQNSLWKLNNERSIRAFFSIWNWEQNTL